MDTELVKVLTDVVVGQNVQKHLIISGNNVKLGEMLLLFFPLVRQTGIGM